MKRLRQLFGPCALGHAKDYQTRRDAEGHMRKECPRCHALLGIVLGGNVVTTGPEQTQRHCAGTPSGRATLVDQPKPKVARFR